MKLIIRHITIILLAMGVLVSVSSWVSAGAYQTESKIVNPLKADQSLPLQEVPYSDSSDTDNLSEDNDNLICWFEINFCAAPTAKFFVELKLILISGSSSPLFAPPKVLYV